MDPGDYQRLVIQVSALAGIILLVYARESVLLYASRFDKVPQHTSILTGQDWINELIAGHDGRFYNELGMHKHVFWALLAILRRETGLGDTRHVSAEEQLAIFLHYAHRGLSNRALQERFQRSGDTISKCVHRILDALVSEKFYGAYVKLPTRNTRPHESILNNEGYYPYFKDCIGAIDGTHVPAFVPEDKRAPFRNRKGTISQNVLAACSFDFKFVYVLPGWEGSASDSVVYQDAKATDFQIPDGKYFLADAGYPNTDALLAPYRKVRYHLREWGNGDRNDRPCNYKELFNLRHSQLRNAIERIFGVLKKRYKVLLLAQEYSFATQAQIVSAVAALHNFIIVHDPSDEEFTNEDDEDDTEANTDESDDAWSAHQAAVMDEERTRAAERRDRIAKEMWENYTARARHRRR